MATQDVTIRFEGDTSHLDRALRRAQRGLRNIETSSAQATKALQGINAAAGRISGALTAAGVAFAGFVTGRGIQGIVNATQQMEGFRTQLTTYLGSQQLANAELQRLSTLARSLPQDVAELTQAFVIFNRFGIDTSNESMKAFSNIAAANSKSIIQLGEAVADAMTGEFERLKEFGIKVSTENGKFTAKIGEDQVAVATSTTELVEKLKALGEEGGRFGSVGVGGLTLALSNFRGAIFETAAALGEGGLGLAIADTLNGFTDLITKNDQVVTAIGDGLTKAFLYAVEAGQFLFNNIELIAKGFAILMGIAITRWAFAVAAALGGPLLKAFVLLGKAAKASALLLLRHPLIALAAVIVGGIEYVTGAVSGLAEKLGLIGDDSALEKLLIDGKALGSELAGPVVGALEQFNNISASVDAKFADIKARANETNKTLDEGAAAIERQRRAAEQVAAAESSRAAQVKQIIADKYEELRVSGLSTDEQKLYNLEKEIEQKIGKQITDQERATLAELVNQTKQIERQNNIRARSQEIAKNTLQGTIYGILDEQEAINGVIKALEEQKGIYGDIAKVHSELLQGTISLEAITQAEIANLKIENARKVDEKIRQIEETRIRNLLAMNKTGIAQQLSEWDSFVLQRIGQEERQQRIINDRIEFEKKSEAEKWQWAVSQGADAFEQLGRYNKQAFEASKALRIAEAIMNTYQGVTLALATYPPPFNFIGAAAVLAAGLANVATIRSQTYSGRALGGPVMGNETYMVGENGPELFTPSTSGRITRNDQIGNGTPVNINFTINAVDTTSFDELLINRRGVIQQVISDAMLESGQRSRF